jgi:hypothetical protein
MHTQKKLVETKTLLKKTIKGSYKKVYISNKQSFIKVKPPITLDLQNKVKSNLLSKNKTKLINKYELGVLQNNNFFKKIFDIKNFNENINLKLYNMINYHNFDIYNLIGFRSIHNIESIKYDNIELLFKLILKIQIEINNFKSNVLYFGYKFNYYLL